MTRQFPNAVTVQYAPNNCRLNIAQDPAQYKKFDALLYEHRRNRHNRHLEPIHTGTIGAYCTQCRNIFWHILYTKNCSFASLLAMPPRWNSRGIQLLMTNLFFPAPIPVPIGAFSPMTRPHQWNSSRESSCAPLKQKVARAQGKSPWHATVTARCVPGAGGVMTRYWPILARVARYCLGLILSGFGTIWNADKIELRITLPDTNPRSEVVARYRT